MTDEEVLEILAWMQNDDYPKYSEALERAMECVRNAQKKRRRKVGWTGAWVPVSEKLPPEDEEVLVTRDFLGVKDDKVGYYAYLKPCRYVEIAQLTGGAWVGNSDEYKVARNRHTDPVAWMPLPEPYKEVENDNNK